MKSGTFFIELSETYDEAGQQFLGGGLDCTDEDGNSLDGLFTGDATAQDQVADDHQGGVGAGQDDSIQDNLAVLEQFC